VIRYDTKISDYDTIVGEQPPLKLKPDMQPGLPAEVVRPFAFHGLEGIGNILPYWPVRESHGWFEEEAVIEEFDVIPQAIGQVQGVSISDLDVVLIHVFFEGVQCVDGCLGAFPPIMLVCERRC